MCLLIIVIIVVNKRRESRLIFNKRGTDQISNVFLASYFYIIIDENKKEPIKNITYLINVLFVILPLQKSYDLI